MAQQSSSNVIVINQPNKQSSTPGGKQEAKKPAPLAVTGMHYRQTVQWNSGLCGCCDDLNSCCYAFWCYPCFEGLVAKEMFEWTHGPQCIDIYCIHCIPTCPGKCFQTAMRSTMRALFEIEGTVMKDAVTVWLCPWCAMTQLHRELRHRAYSRI